MELSFRRWKSQGPTQAKILLLHGMGGTGSLWRPVAAGLEDHFDLLAPDQRGHGDSRILAIPGGRSPETYLPLDYGTDIIQTMRAQNFHPAWLVGHSMGVRSACAAFHLQPDWVQGMVLVDLGFSGLAGGGLGEGLAEFLKKLPLAFNSRAEARNFMQMECPDPSIGQYLMAVSVPQHDGGVTFPFDRAALIETIYAARDASVQAWIEEAGRLSKPVLILRGAQSQVWTETDFEATRLKLAAYPSLRFETFEGTGHGLPFEKRIQFVQRVREFITQYPG